LENHRLFTEVFLISKTSPRADRFPHTRLSTFTRRLYQRLLMVLSWIWVGLIAVVVINVTMRYAFGEGRIEFEELQWHLFSVGFLLGIATCMDTDNHIRVDIFHERMSLQKQAWVEIYGLLLLLIPFAIALLVFSIPFVTYSYEIAEVSDAPGGLPFRWVIKSFLPLSLILVLLAAFSRLSRVTAYLFGWPRHVD
jgi:TRAP-type mannitol/chloroaromatic compound transport system permease small subunit